MIEYEKRAMIEAEDKYTFRQSTQISMQTGLIGHLRADMDTDGNGFFSSWFDFREELKTDGFKACLLYTSWTIITGIRNGRRVGMTQDRFFAKGAVYPFDGTPAPFPPLALSPSFTGNTSSKRK